MRRSTLYLLFFVLIWCVGVDPVLANKFETISGGVSGMDREKIRLLKDISLYAGSFLIFLAMAAMLTRNRFEGFVGHSGGKGKGSVVRGATILTAVGIVFIGLSFL
ncbi:MAG: hypothetical protein GY792_32035 [Gammaproteobacteria bacterium]|nr:hypothetical protein [Gammaproteobacteria bacterium]